MAEHYQQHHRITWPKCKINIQSVALGFAPGADSGAGTQYANRGANPIYISIYIYVIYRETDRQTDRQTEKRNIENHRAALHCTTEYRVGQ